MPAKPHGAQAPSDTPEPKTRTQPRAHMPWGAKDSKLKARETTFLSLLLFSRICDPRTPCSLSEPQRHLISCVGLQGAQKANARGS